MDEIDTCISQLIATNQQPTIGTLGPIFSLGSLIQGMGLVHTILFSESIVFILFELDLKGCNLLVNKIRPRIGIYELINQSREKSEKRKSYITEEFLQSRLSTITGLMERDRTSLYSYTDDVFIR